jgi:ribosomal protein S18 acetylase RimI-like enzyme
MPATAGTPWTIRPLRPGDGADMARLHHRAIMATHEDFYSIDERRSWSSGLDPAQYKVPEHGHFDVVEADAVVIAFRDHVADEVLGLYIDPAWQGRGIGSALMRQAEARMIAMGTTLAKIHAALSSQAFYEKHGYRVTEYTEHRSRGGLLLRSVRLVKSIG